MDKYNPQRKVGCCPNPAHDDHNPSCSYNPKTHSFYCFSCGFSVDVIDAHMMANNSTFLEACEYLFHEAGIGYDFTEKGIKASSQYRYPKPVYADNKDKVYEYWELRQISPQTVDYLDIQQDEHGNTIFQYYDLNDVLVMCKVRKSGAVQKGETKIWCLPGSDTSHILYNISKINQSQPLIITSGEGDCATAIECGFYNTVSIPFGDKNLQFIGECWDFLQKFNEIIIVHDNDESGIKFCKEISTRLGEYRVKIAEIPIAYEKEDGTRVRIKDLNELLFRHGKEAVREVIKNAKDTEIDSVVDYTEIEDFDMTDSDGFTLGINEYDYYLGKFYEGSTTIITGIAGSGKSSLLSTVICQSVDQGFPCWIYSGELDNRSLRSWIKYVHAGQRGLNEYENPLKKKYYKVKGSASDAINKKYKGKIWFYKDTFEPFSNKLLQTMENMVRKKGVKTFIIDNLTVVSLDCDDKNKYIKQEEFIRDVINFAKKWHVVCILVLHPKKMDAIRRMTLFDLQGVTASANLAHRVLSLYRVQPKDKEGVKNRNGDYVVPPINYDVILDVLKDRYGSAGNQSIGLYYDIPSRRFFTNEENLDYRYSWDSSDYGSTRLPFGAPQLHTEGEEEVIGIV